MRRVVGERVVATEVCNRTDRNRNESSSFVLPYESKPSSSFTSVRKSRPHCSSEASSWSLPEILVLVARWKKTTASSYSNEGGRGGSIPTDMDDDPVLACGFWNRCKSWCRSRWICRRRCCCGRTVKADTTPGPVATAYRLSALLISSLSGRFVYNTTKTRTIIAAVDTRNPKECDRRKDRDNGIIAVELLRVFAPCVPSGCAANRPNTVVGVYLQR